MTFLDWPDTTTRVTAASLNLLGGGHELGYAEITTGQGPISNLISSPVDIGLQIVVPAGVDYVVELYLPLLQVNTGGSWVSGNGPPNVAVQIVDDGGVVLGSANSRVAATAINQAWIQPFLLRRRLSAAGSAKTIKAQWGHFASSTNMQASLFAGTGTGTTNGGFPPAYLQAYTR